ncbi:hypothetical protein GGE46_001829 [Rhizobium etli]|uniref:Transmembrane protein n=4 Tax=Rhizobium TaxID=379 RepID=A0A7W7EE25_RHIET|nr:hypothetical protein [Rhizobium etli]MBB4535517.1 hypothetical protein [Rhizobium etli]
MSLVRAACPRFLFGRCVIILQSPDISSRYALAFADYYCAVLFSAVDINGSFNTFCQRSASIKHLACVFKRLDLMDDDFWKAVREKERASSASRRTGALNIALLFGTAVVALTLILTPMLADSSKKSVFASAPVDFDTITTGSIPKNEGGKRYTIRRSVLQETPGSVCVVEGYGVGAGC